jgi:hypothetical protein
VRACNCPCLSYPCCVLAVLLVLPAEAASSDVSGEAVASDDSSAEEPADSSDENEEAEQSGGLAASNVWCALPLLQIDPAAAIDQPALCAAGVLSTGQDSVAAAAC